MSQNPVQAMELLALSDLAIEKLLGDYANLEKMSVPKPTL